MIKDYRAATSLSLENYVLSILDTFTFYLDCTWGYKQVFILNFKTTCFFLFSISSCFLSTKHEFSTLYKSIQNVSWNNLHTEAYHLSYSVTHTVLWTDTLFHR